MRAALLHLDVSGGPERANLTALQRAIRLAAAEGAILIVTPEIAVQGYFFAEKTGVAQIPLQPDRSLQEVIQLVVRHQLTLFLGCAERDAETGSLHNSCLVIGPEGRILGRHRKMRVHGKGAEAWATPGMALEPISCPGLKAGVLICADSWFVENAGALKKRGPKSSWCHRHGHRESVGRATVGKSVPRRPGCRSGSAIKRAFRKNWTLAGHRAWWSSAAERSSATAVCSRPCCFLTGTAAGNVPSRRSLQ